MNATRLIPGDGLGFQMVNATRGCLSALLRGLVSRRQPYSASLDLVRLVPSPRLSSSLVLQTIAVPVLLTPALHRPPRNRNSRMKCHVCGISETPEWRCGPDGIGTLCNVCGLIFAKQQRKQSH
ncbi:hypothetical protein L249_0109 [Ophiocordyceps polyrhachis-furcata BCC 54312]|uniref:GATA-type domain-containing protein n=1 Tax=Ophiocordyceps polyrhachis-furcata BCC 54312 TaxID=1330021 RepID=A0A367LEC5_9HYPO|nr:hypothetical protein L249_0109 [Ophiocordyceps polyrhachis-furcata BCC 54312]